MGDHDDLPLPRRSSDTQVRRQGDRETHLGAGPHARQPSPVSVGDCFGDFRLERFLGEGSSGYVYRALDSITNRHYALKLICSEPAENLVRTKLGFRRMMRIEHPNLAQADRIHRVGNQIALSMEEIHGETLAKSIRALRTLSTDEACNRLLSLMRDYASALAAMHSHCLVHRDIKPQNLMIDDNGNGRIIDYGLVGTFDAEIDSASQRNYLVGTPGYFAPEALSKQSYLPAGDIYGLGCVILESLRAISAEGILPSANPTPKILDSDSVDPDQNNEDAIHAALEDIANSVPAVLYDACIEMLQPAPGDRPTAMQIARHGLNQSVCLAWSPEKPMHGRTAEYEKVCDWIRTIYAGDQGRLHLHGPSGIGKTRLIDEVEKFLKTKPYGQVFRARCRPREDHPLQAFDQIADEVANRYMKNDLQRCRLDPVSAGILHEVFPVLKNVVEVNMEYPIQRLPINRHDALEAAARMSVELRKNGPLILIIDDVQWADPDSLAVLDRLRESDGGSLGIITASRTVESNQQRPADVNLELQQLTAEDSLFMLAEAANRWSTEIDLPDLVKLAEMMEGNPFRLSELAEEFRPGGLLASPDHCAELAHSISQGETLNWLCHRRVERLSPEARLILPLIVAAARPVSVEQIGAVSKLGEHIDAPLSELVQHRLVTDEAQGNECVSVAHDRVSDGLVSILDTATIKRSHKAWADWLLQQDQPHLSAARVAGHLFDADEPSRAISSAVLAAKQSEKIYAYRDAGKWYARIAPLVSGTERIQCLRDASRCFEEADLPVDAAQHYNELAKYVDAEERIRCQVAAVRLLIRSGRFAEVRIQLRDLTRELGLPRPKGKWHGRLSIAWQLANLELQHRRRRKTMIKAARGNKTPSPKSSTGRDRERMNLCLAMARPLSMFDNLHASELNLYAARLAQADDDVKTQLYIAIGSAVFSSYDRGPARIRGETLLQDLRPRVVALGDDELLGDYWAANAFTHTFSFRWHLVCERAEKSIYYYNKLERPHRFEISHTRMNNIWAHWHLGRWTELAKQHDTLMSESLQRNDIIQRLQATSGFCASAWLARDEPDEVIRAAKPNADCLSQQVGAQMYDHECWISSVQHAIYCGDWDRASKIIAQYPRLRNRSSLKQLQLFRVTYLQTGALVALHRMQSDGHSKWYAAANKFIAALRGEQLEYTNAVSGMLDGLCQQLAGDPDQARRHLQTANTLAAKHRLRPIQCATNDALEKIDTGIYGDSLQERMQHRGVAKPDLFERLYTVRVSR
tara:strand:+ start:9500 stop:13288 length:3789 start_codon:yes stop_codon:yes gene_type:complete